MLEEERIIIANIAEKTRSLGNNEFPVPVFDIAKRLGVDIIEVADLDDAFGGKFTKDKDGCKIMISKRILTESEKRFIIAHELGHFILHSGSFNLDAGKLNLYYGNTADFDSGLELEADEFATALLVPCEEFKKLYKALQDDDTVISKIAEHFGVSTRVVEHRFLTLL